MMTKEERDELRSQANFEASDGKWRMHRLTLKNGLVACLDDLDAKDKWIAALGEALDAEISLCLRRGERIAELEAEIRGLRKECSLRG